MANTIPLADGTNAGLISPTEKATLAASSAGLLGISYITNDRTSSGTAGDITLADSDAGYNLQKKASDSTSRTVTIPSSLTVGKAWPFSATEGPVVFSAGAGSTLYLMDGSSGSKSSVTAAQYCDGIIKCVASGKYTIAGTSLS